MRYVLLAIFVIMTTIVAASFITDNAQAASLQLAASDQPTICFKKCLDKYGEDKKATCAMDCGLVQSPNVSSPARDCGTIYKSCMRGCGKDKACQKPCRAARTSCF